MSQPFDFATDGILEKKIRSDVRDQLKTFLKQNPTPDAQFREIFKVRPRSIGWSNFLRLIILHRQFSEGTVPGLPVLVRGARFLYNRYRNLKKIMPDNS